MRTGKNALEVLRIVAWMALPCTASEYERTGKNAGELLEIVHKKDNNVLIVRNIKSGSLYSVSVYNRIMKVSGAPYAQGGSRMKENGNTGEWETINTGTTARVRRLNLAIVGGLPILRAWKMCVLK